MKIKQLAVLVLSVLAVNSYGAGFALYEYSGRSTAMGGAVMAGDAEPASLATNPSLITELEGTQIQAGLTAVQAHAKTTFAGQSRTLKKDTCLYRILRAGWRIATCSRGERRNAHLVEPYHQNHCLCHKFLHAFACISSTNDRSSSPTIFS